MRRMGDGTDAETAERCLDAREHAAAMELVHAVRHRVGAKLECALLFGSKARGTARPDSDVDVLFVFKRLPPDREPQATHAERIAEHVAARTGVPVGVWCVSREDTDPGRRTPMLVDALEDAVPLWPAACDVPRAAFTPADAAFCAARLLDRVEEGSAEVARALAEGDDQAWAKRARDDLVRLCTAVLLLAGETRPRRGDAVRRFLERNPRFAEDREARAVLAWAARSYPPGHLELDDDTPVPPPPVRADAALDTAQRLRSLVIERGRAARRRGTFVQSAQ
ncbi:nucleotidyltransferase domain-containing protein [Longimicrobium sp.]|uniref:nucleotidyltransferase domain-containing protein n=1 Tax=Longimicrobium sp. TaxID=2029185 RepID=UPI002E36B01E|nr:nucleotidyltransferase domain-containing protein [Longimicrobium sp.]HEX6039860.1 nucleotidyltransferase domain-containing protein [Longimicrobium sp.]